MTTAGGIARARALLTPLVRRLATGVVGTHTGRVRPDPARMGLPHVPLTAVIPLCLALCLTLAASPLLAQTQPAQNPPAVLVADEVFVEENSRLVATGNVEALQGDMHLTAGSIIYDREGNLLTIEGPIRITDPKNGVIILASAAELDEGFRNGLLTGARMVLDQQLQLAAVEAQRVDGRYTQLSRVAATSCQVCGPNQIPLWQIRASRVIHDQEERQLYFDDAQVRVMDVPIFYLPRLRLPDPSLKRARGFLFPTFTSSTLLGFGVKVPYFIPIGNHQDVTLTPHLTTKSRSLEFRYRRAFHRGNVTVTGALSSDEFRNETMRGYLNAAGEFSVGRGYDLEFSLNSVSDDAYLNDYDISGADRLASSLTLQRVRRDTRVSFGIDSYQTLRNDEENATQPGVIIDMRYERRWLDRLPGELRFSSEIHGHHRSSELDVDGSDADTVVDGRDVARLNLEASWQNRWTLGPGLRVGARGYLWLDHFNTQNDAAVPQSISRATPGASVELRWPLLRHGSAGGRTLLEPVLQMGWVGDERPANANDESTLVEFDESNLLSLSRFPAPDRREHGATMAAGLRWMHEAQQGWSAALTFGRVWREDMDPDFSRSSGLDSLESDWLIAGRFANPLGLTVSARGLLDETNRFSKAEARAGWSTPRMDLGASYVLLVEDPDEGRSEAQSEWTFDSRYRLTRHWETSSEARYDLVGQRLDRVGLGLQYRNECVEVDFGATRKYASATNLEPSTDFDLTVALTGFGTNGSDKEYARTCRF